LSFLCDIDHYKNQQPALTLIDHATLLIINRSQNQRNIFFLIRNPAKLRRDLR